ncbi:predicted protein [Naegleria gruberi]|uniref:Predicted protein n=1 Tax=Naegleria gruberi TaxID=5762 RepID=D2VT33_NAEGR|nr:uncharacterized protein NAEGRDRAFT_72157 [Naegleria gruberi]EFC40014.1 predicted protein [Naegleria gruberi]|eukprot:XP_002672758.1 predicted protein [Naegleria gruberi strain NEG-M]
MHNRKQGESHDIFHDNLSSSSPPTNISKSAHPSEILENQVDNSSAKFNLHGETDLNTTSKTTSCCFCCSCSPFGMRMIRAASLMGLLLLIIAFFVWALPLLRLVYWNSKHFSQTGLRILEANSKISPLEERNLVEKVEKESGIHLINRKGLELFGLESSEILKDFSVLYQLKIVMQERRIGDKLFPIIDDIIENFYKKLLIRPSTITRSIHQTYKTKDLNLMPEHWKDSPERWVQYKDLYVNDYLDDKIDPDLRREVSVTYNYNLWIDEEMDQFVQSSDWKSVSEFNENYYDSFFKSIPMKIQKIDAIRYCWLSRIGGIYSDLDVRPIRDIEELLRYLELYHIIEAFKQKNSNQVLTLKEKFHKMVQYLKDSLETGSNESKFEPEWQSIQIEFQRIAKMKPKFSAVVPKTYPFGISNDFLIGARNSEFFQFVVQRSVAEFSRWKLLSYIPIARYAYVMLTGGPLFLSECYRQFTLEKAKKCKY